MDRIRSLIGRLVPLLGFKDSRNYWETRYRMGGNSGEGSRGVNATHKADVLNRFIQENGIRSLIEFGCGDGYQLSMLNAPDYTGVDVSKTVVERCREMYRDDTSKRFLLLDEYKGQKADLSMSLDVIFHLVEDSIYDEYLSRLFDAAERYVIIYSTSADIASTGTPHVRHRDCATDVASRFGNFTRLVDLEARLPPPVRFDRGLPTSFFLYQRIP